MRTKLTDLQIQTIEQHLTWLVDKHTWYCFNDAQTRNAVITDINQYLKMLTGYDITSYKVICDDVINTPKVIDNNGFRAVVIIDYGEKQNITWNYNIR